LFFQVWRELFLEREMVPELATEPNRISCHLDTEVQLQDKMDQHQEMMDLRRVKKEPHQAMMLTGFHMFK
jgi:hypothetical protein